MKVGNKPSEDVRPASPPKSSLGSEGGERSRTNKYWHYLFVVSVLLVLLSALALLNAHFHFDNVSSYATNHGGLPSSYLFAGYLGMFISMAILPIPDYLLVPAYGYLSSMGLFNPYTTFLVCLAGDLFPLEYVCGWLVARPLLLRGLSMIGISEKDIKVADEWLVEHGRFSIFISTFIPYFYSVASLAAGTLKMKPVPFFLYSAAGFGVRLAFLEYAGYFAIYLFSASFDYSQGTLFAALLILSSTYVAVHLARTLRPTGHIVSVS